MATDKGMGEGEDFEIVNESDLEFTSRGRKSKISPEEIQKVKDLLKKNPNGWVVFNNKAIPKGMTEKKEMTNHKATVSANFRTLGKAMGMKTEIRWHKGTVPAVRFTKVSA
jgi:ABC-type tungstate transport system permease subunit